MEKRWKKEKEFSKDSREIYSPKEIANLPKKWNLL